MCVWDHVCISNLQADPVPDKTTFYLADADSTNDLEQSLTSPSTAIPVPHQVYSPTDLAETGNGLYVRYLP